MIITNGGETLSQNLRGDSYAANAWGLTHLENPDFTASSRPSVVNRIQSYYQPGPLAVMEIGAGTATFGRDTCEQLRIRGYTPSLFTSELQQTSVRATPVSADIVPTVSNSLWLPIQTASLEDRTPRLGLSRAVNHYSLPDEQLGLGKELGRVLGPGQLWINQISSGDAVMLKVFERLLQTISGKKMYYLTEEGYQSYASRLVGKDGKLIFETQLLGYADSQPRGVLELARRYLNERFVELNRDQIALNGYTDKDMYHELDCLAATERDLGEQVRRGLVSRTKALDDLDDLLKRTHIFRYFRGVIVGTVRSQFLEGLRHGQGAGSDNLVLYTGNEGEDVMINIQYPIYSHTRTESPL